MLECQCASKSSGQPPWRGRVKGAGALMSAERGVPHISTILEGECKCEGGNKAYSQHE
eukprot:CAMPEP_0169431356 /NCGR_PEP_ID=MMETSP1042-20121227/2902_2 /TAXON_ID=464988 /ORGANISM="Hemiselmis andersenii, Strain CCMP1180" /LENGTH=57 /DNA_ID=CAMNT_0009541759 /DNA_START=279 /DNA_END=449 /DNA_ORIENTATION=-